MQLRFDAISFQTQGVEGLVFLHTASTSSASKPISLHRLSIKALLSLPFQNKPVNVCENMSAQILAS